MFASIFRGKAAPTPHNAGGADQGPQSSLIDSMREQRMGPIASRVRPAMAPAANKKHENVDHHLNNAKKAKDPMEKRRHIFAALQASNRAKKAQAPASSDMDADDGMMGGMSGGMGF